MKIEEKLDLSCAQKYAVARNNLCKNIRKHWQKSCGTLSESQISIDNLMLSYGQIHKTMPLINKDLFYLVIPHVVRAGISVDKNVTIVECANVQLTDEEKKQITTELEVFYDDNAKIVEEHRAYFEKQPHAAIQGLSVSDAVFTLTRMGLGWDVPRKIDKRGRSNDIDDSEYDSDNDEND